MFLLLIQLYTTALSDTDPLSDKIVGQLYLLSRVNLVSRIRINKLQRAWCNSKSN